MVGWLERVIEMSIWESILELEIFSEKYKLCIEVEIDFVEKYKLCREVEFFLQNETFKRSGSRQVVIEGKCWMIDVEKMVESNNWF